MSPEAFSSPEKLTFSQILEAYGDVLVSAHGKIMKLSETPEKCQPFIDALLQAESRLIQEQIIDLYKIEES